MGTSPAQWFSGHCCITHVPIVKSILKPKYPVKQDVQELQAQKQHQQKYHNQHGKDLKPINTDETVKMRLPGETIQSLGTCTVIPGPRSYAINVGSKTYWLNWCHLIAHMRPNWEDTTLDQQISDSEEGMDNDNRTPRTSQFVQIPERSQITLLDGRSFSIAFNFLTFYTPSTGQSIQQILFFVGKKDVTGCHVTSHNSELSFLCMLCHVSIIIICITLYFGCAVILTTVEKFSKDVAKNFQKKLQKFKFCELTLIYRITTQYSTKYLSLENFCLELFCC